MRIGVLPDPQIKPDVPVDHLYWAGQYFAEKKPDAVVVLGDWWDMPSLSSYDKGKKSFEGRRYKEDILAGRIGMELFLEPIRQEQEKLAKQHKKVWQPRMVFTLGNHEQRIERAIERQAELEGLMSYADFGLEEYGWEVYPFLEVVVIEGVAFSHYFTSGILGRPVTSPQALLTKKMMSCIMGHVQDRGICEGKRADGKRMTAIFAGIFYQHDEDYLGAQGNTSWRGIWVLNEVSDGQFDYMPVSLEFLRNKYDVQKGT